MDIYIGLLQAVGVPDVVAVDLDIHDDPELYESVPCYCSEIHRIKEDELYLLPDDPANTALLFSYGRRIPLEAYLNHYPTLQAVIIIGDVMKTRSNIEADEGGGGGYGDCSRNAASGGRRDGAGRTTVASEASAACLLPSRSSVTQPPADALVGRKEWDLVHTQTIRGSLRSPDCMLYFYTAAT